jgi:dipeptidyl aminopeptidase/acylaminoacyl peptidase
MRKTYYLGILLAVLVLTACSHNSPRTEQINEGDFSNQLTQNEISHGKLTPEILWKFGRVSETHLSPDGRQIIYNVTRYDSKTNKKLTWIFLISSDGGNSVNLTSDMPSCDNPRWVTNNKIAFLSSKDGPSQIWIMNADGSGKTRISKVEGDINGFEFSGDGNNLFYLQNVKMDSTTQDKYPDLPLAQGRIITDMMYRHWNSWSNYSHSHIFISRLKNNKILAGTDILKGQPFDSPLPPFFDISEIAWSPDGKMLAYSCKKLKGKNFALSTNSDIYIYHIDNGTTENITEGMMGYDRYPVFSHDNKKIAFQSMKTPGYESDKARLFVYDVVTKKREYLTDKFDQDVSNCVWSSNNQKIYFISGIHATFQIYSIQLNSCNIQKLTNGNHDYTDFNCNNSVMVGTKMSQSMAPEIFRIDKEKGKETQLTFVNKNIYDAIKMGKSAERWVNTTDGKKMLVWVIYPPDFDPHKKYPALLFCEGGPQDAVSQFFSYRWNFQIMSANGYIVVAPNRRGLPTFGEAWDKEISGDYGGQNMKDYLSAIDDVSKEPYVDADHLGAVGASYGGYSVFYLAGCHKKRFKAFIAHCGMFNLESFSSSTEEMFFVRQDLGGFYWDKPTPVSYTAFSPNQFVRNWDTPIMMITGANDFRVPYTESFQAFNIAQLRGIPSKLLFFPDEGHWVLKPQNSILWQREFFGWLDKWLKK